MTKIILKSLWSGSKFTFEVLKVPLLFVNNSYFKILKLILTFLKPIGIVGEILSTLFGLVYMLWPMAIAYFYGIIELYIPAVIFTVILIIQGRKIIIAYG